MQYEQLRLFDHLKGDDMATNRLKEAAKFIQELGFNVIDGPDAPSMEQITVSAALLAAHSVITTNMHLINEMAQVLSNAVAKGSLDEEAALRVLTEWRDQ